ncbi:hypothetical protein BDR26DRAFT_798797 [Obelidium mucronatum]|nr:hypothetical protein BDR26DRAFT_798797 [Obelidium mucronatum]
MANVIPNQDIFVRYLGNQPVGIRTHQLINATGVWAQTLFSISNVIRASTSDANRRLLGLPEDYGPLTLHAVVDGLEGPALESETLLSTLASVLSARARPIHHQVAKRGLRFVPPPLGPLGQ